MQSGDFWGYVGRIDGLVERDKHEFGAPMSVVATGGLAPLFDGATSVIDSIDPDLTLWGLRLIYRQNTNK
jgi:type III pantothenate kinase